MQPLLHRDREKLKSEKRHRGKPVRRFFITVSQLSLKVGWANPVIVGYCPCMNQMFDAYVTAALFCGADAFFALGDGTVRLDDGTKPKAPSVQAHDGAVLCAAPHPSGEGLITGGDDGKLVWTRREGEGLTCQTLADAKGRWIDSLATSAVTGLIAYATGKMLIVLDANDARFARNFSHERSVAAIGFDPKGRRLAAATYGGVALWYARIADQKPQFLKWAGSHVGVCFSPDGKFVLSTMQENQLHGWRLSDSKDMRMGGYPAKIKSLSFLAKGLILATSGSNGVVAWPFVGANGPMGKEAAEVGYDQAALVTQVCGALNHNVLAAGLDDGRVWVCDLRSQKIETLKGEKGAAISALSVNSRGDRLVWGDEDGQAGTFAIPVLYP